MQTTAPSRSHHATTTVTLGAAIAALCMIAYGHAAEPAHAAARVVRATALNTQTLPMDTVPNPTSAAPSTDVTVTVSVSPAPDQTQPVAISTNQPSGFTNLPSSVNVAAGATSVQFQVTTSSSFSGASITAACNGGYATGVIGTGD